MEAVNGVSDGGGPPPPSPLTGCYLLIVIGEPHSQEHKNIILQRIAKGLLSWDVNDCLIDLEKELAIITEQAPEGEEARYGERLIQYASENLVTEVLIHPAVSTLAQCVRNLLSSFTRHRHIIHAGYTFAANGSWILQDGTFSYTDFAEAFHEIEVQRVIRAYENSISVDLHCSPEGDWTRLPKESFAKSCKVRVNPVDVLTSGSPPITNFLNYISPFLVSTDVENLLECSDVVGNIRFSHPTLYIFPGGQGDAALFGINGFNMLLDGGFSRKACFWDFVRHLDRLDAVLLTRLNNGNACGISAVLRRKMQNALYPQIGHFFCNIQERKSILSPDGDKDKDPLLINLLDEGQEIITNLKKLNLAPQVCYRDTEPINLYHKVGHGTLDMYVLSPAKDSKEVKDFLHRWNTNDQKLFANQRNIKDFQFPLQNLVSICALLIWQPANPNDNITRILYPGSTPQQKIFEGLDKLRNLDYIKYPVCSESKLITSSSIMALKSKQLKDASLEKLIQGESKRIEKLKEKPPKSGEMKNKMENKLADNMEKIEMTNGVSSENETDKTVKKSDSTDSDKSIKSTKLKKADEKIEEKKPKYETRTREVRSKPKIDSKPEKRKSLQDKKASPTTPKKTIESKTNGEVKEKEKPISKPMKYSPSTTPAKSAKEATNRKVIESKNRMITKKETKTSTEKKDTKPERKPISRRTKGPSPTTKTVSSPVKKISEVHKPDIIKKAKLDKEGTTDSSTVSTPSADQKDLTKLTPEEIEQLKAQELADLKEEQEVVKEIEAVFRKGETEKDSDTELRKIKDISLEDKSEPEEYLIIEKEEVEHDSLDDKEKEDETQKHARDSEESEKMRKLSDDNKVSLKEKELSKYEPEDLKDKEDKEKPTDTPKEISVTSPEDKIDISIEKKTVDIDNQEQNIALESQPDEKYSATAESGATTAPTLPEDERITLDEIKEDNGDQVIEEKHVKEDTKEKDVPVIQFPTKTFETIPKLPPVVGIRLDKQSHIRDIVKTPDEVADLPVHEEADIEQYQMDVMKSSMKEEGKVEVKAQEKIDISTKEVKDTEVPEVNDKDVKKEIQIDIKEAADVSKSKQIISEKETIEKTEKEDEVTSAPETKIPDSEPKEEVIKLAKTQQEIVKTQDIKKEKIKEVEEKLIADEIVKPIKVPEKTTEAVADIKKEKVIADEIVKPVKAPKTTTEALADIKKEEIIADEIVKPIKAPEETTEAATDIKKEDKKSTEDVVKEKLEDEAIEKSKKDDIIKSEKKEKDEKEEKTEKILNEIPTVHDVEERISDETVDKLDDLKHPILLEEDAKKQDLDKQVGEVAEVSPPVSLEKVVIEVTEKEIETKPKLQETSIEVDKVLEVKETEKEDKISIQEKEIKLDAKDATIDEEKYLKKEEAEVLVEKEKELKKEVEKQDTKPDTETALEKDSKKLSEERETDIAPKEKPLAQEITDATSKEFIKEDTVESAADLTKTDIIKKDEIKEIKEDEIKEIKEDEIKDDIKDVSAKKEDVSTEKVSKIDQVKEIAVKSTLLEQKLPEAEEKPQIKEAAELVTEEIQKENLVASDIELTKTDTAKEDVIKVELAKEDISTENVIKADHMEKTAEEEMPKLSPEKKDLELSKSEQKVNVDEIQKIVTQEKQIDVKLKEDLVVDDIKTTEIESISKDIKTTDTQTILELQNTEVSVPSTKEPEQKELEQTLKETEQNLFDKGKEPIEVKAIEISALDATEPHIKATETKTGPSKDIEKLETKIEKPEESVKVDDVIDVTSHDGRQEAQIIDNEAKILAMDEIEIQESSDKHDVTFYIGDEKLERSKTEQKVEKVETKEEKKSKLDEKDVDDKQRQDVETEETVDKPKDDTLHKIEDKSGEKKADDPLVVAKEHPTDKAADKEVPTQSDAEVEEIKTKDEIKDSGKIVKSEEKEDTLPDISSQDVVCDSNKYTNGVQQKTEAMKQTDIVQKTFAEDEKGTKEIAEQKAEKEEAIERADKDEQLLKRDEKMVDKEHVIEEEVLLNGESVKEDIHVDETICQKEVLSDAKDLPVDDKEETKVPTEIAKTTIDSDTKAGEAITSVTEKLTEKTADKDTLSLKETQLEEAKSGSQTESPETSSEQALQTFKENDILDKIELGRKSPKEREQDVAKIVASVAEVLKSDAPLEEFEGKIPLTIAPFVPFTATYTTELRETHITTVDSPISEQQRSVAEPKLEIEKLPETVTKEEQEVDKKESKISELLRDSKELMQATSKMISDIKSAKVEEPKLDSDTGTVQRMLVTASSEDGGEEIEICPKGTITFPRSSESSGRSSPDATIQKMKPDDDSKKSSGKSTPEVKVVSEQEKADLESTEKEPLSTKSSGKSTPRSGKESPEYRDQSPASDSGITEVTKQEIKSGTSTPELKDVSKKSMDVKDSSSALESERKCSDAEKSASETDLKADTLKEPEVKAAFDSGRSSPDSKTMDDINRDERMDAKYISERPEADKKVSKFEETIAESEKKVTDSKHEEDKILEEGKKSETKISDSSIPISETMDTKVSEKRDVVKDKIPETEKSKDTVMDHKISEKSVSDEPTDVLDKSKHDLAETLTCEKHILDLDKEAKTPSTSPKIQSDKDEEVISTDHTKETKLHDKTKEDLDGDKPKQIDLELRDDDDLKLDEIPPAYEDLEQPKLELSETKHEVDIKTSAKEVYTLKDEEDNIVKKEVEIHPEDAKHVKESLKESIEAAKEDMEEKRIEKSKEHEETLKTSPEIEELSKKPEDKPTEDEKSVESKQETSIESKEVQIEKAHSKEKDDQISNLLIKKDRDAKIEELKDSEYETKTQESEKVKDIIETMTKQEQLEIIQSQDVLEKAKDSPPMEVIDDKKTSDHKQDQIKSTDMAETLEQSKIEIDIGKEKIDSKHAVRYDKGIPKDISHIDLDREIQKKSEIQEDISDKPKQIDQVSEKLVSEETEQDRTDVEKIQSKTVELSEKHEIEKTLQDGDSKIGQEIKEELESKETKLPKNQKDILEPDTKDEKTDSKLKSTEIKESKEIMGEKIRDAPTDIKATQEAIDSKPDLPEEGLQKESKPKSKEDVDSKTGLYLEESKVEPKIEEAGEKIDLKFDLLKEKAESMPEPKEKEVDLKIEECRPTLIQGDDSKPDLSTERFQEESGEKLKGIDSKSESDKVFQEKSEPKPKEEIDLKSELHKGELQEETKPKLEKEIDFKSEAHKELQEDSKPILKEGIDLGKEESEKEDKSKIKEETDLKSESHKEEVQKESKLDAKEGIDLESEVHKETLQRESETKLKEETDLKSDLYKEDSEIERKPEVKEEIGMKSDLDKEEPQKESKPKSEEEIDLKSELHKEEIKIKLKEEVDFKSKSHEELQKKSLVKLKEEIDLKPELHEEEMQEESKIKLKDEIDLKLESHKEEIQEESKQKLRTEIDLKTDSHKEDIQEETKAKLKKEGIDLKSDLHKEQLPSKDTEDTKTSEEVIRSKDESKIEEIGGKIELSSKVVDESKTADILQDESKIESKDVKSAKELDPEKQLQEKITDQITDHQKEDKPIDTEKKQITGEITKDVIQADLDIKDDKEQLEIKKLDEIKTNLKDSGIEMETTSKKSRQIETKIEATETQATATIKQIEKVSKDAHLEKEISAEDSILKSKVSAEEQIKKGEYIDESSESDIVKIEMSKNKQQIEAKDEDLKLLAEVHESKKLIPDTEDIKGIDKCSKDVKYMALKEEEIGADVDPKPKDSLEKHEIKDSQPLTMDPQDAAEVKEITTVKKLEKDFEEVRSVSPEKEDSKDDISVSKVSLDKEKMGKVSKSDEKDETATVDRKPVEVKEDILPEDEDGKTSDDDISQEISRKALSEKQHVQETHIVDSMTKEEGISIAKQEGIEKKVDYQDKLDESLSKDKIIKDKLIETGKDYTDDHLKRDETKDDKLLDGTELSKPLPKEDKESEKTKEIKTISDIPKEDPESKHERSLDIEGDKISKSSFASVEGKQYDKPAVESKMQEEICKSLKISDICDIPKESMETAIIEKLDALKLTSDVSGVTQGSKDLVEQVLKSPEKGQEQKELEQPGDVEIRKEETISKEISKTDDISASKESTKLLPEIKGDDQGKQESLETPSTIEIFKTCKSFVSKESIRVPSESKQDFVDKTLKESAITTEIQIHGTDSTGTEKIALLTDSSKIIETLQSKVEDQVDKLAEKTSEDKKSLKSELEDKSEDLKESIVPHISKGTLENTKHKEEESKILAQSLENSVITCDTSKDSITTLETGKSSTKIEGKETRIRDEDHLETTKRLVDGIETCSKDKKDELSLQKDSVKIEKCKSIEKVVESTIVDSKLKDEKLDSSKTSVIVDDKKAGVDKIDGLEKTEEKTLIKTETSVTEKTVKDLDVEKGIVEKDIKDAVRVFIETEKDTSIIKETEKDILSNIASSSKDLSKPEETGFSGKSTPDIADVERDKQLQETLSYEKHIPGASTPPTVPVSPIVKDVHSEIKSDISPEKKMEISTIPTTREQDIRSYTPGSDEYEHGVSSTHSDISSSQMSKAPNMLEGEEAKESDEDDILGSPTSVTSQIGHSPSSQYDFDEDKRLSKTDQMSVSFYGSLPGEMEDSGFRSGRFLDESDLDFEKAMQEHRQTRGEDLSGEPSSYLYEITTAKYGSGGKQELEKKTDIMTSSFIGTELPDRSTTEKEQEKDPIGAWGKPLGLPSPAPPDNKGTPKKEKKLPPNVTAKNKLNDDKKRSESPSKYDKKQRKAGGPIYVDLTYVPHHGNSNYSYVDFFKRIRARYYVFSGIEPSKEVYNALLEAKQTWEDKELEVTIIPTYDTDVLGYWVAENEELLTKYKIDLSPSASRCTINLQDHETSCSAYRLEF